MPRFCNLSTLRSAFPPKGRRGHAAEARGGPQRDLTVAVTLDDFAKAGRQVKFRTPELHAARLRRRNPLALARLDVFAPASDWERRHLGGALPCL